MIENIPGLEMFYAAQSARTLEDRGKIKDEFFTMFYKEVLKQAFKPTSFGFDEENENSFTAAYASDLFVEQMARELVKAGVNGQETGR